MTDVELLALGRAVMAALVVGLALRSRWWILGVVGAAGAVVSLGITFLQWQPQTTGVIAYVLYAGLLFHALDVTRRRHPDR